MSKLLNLVDFSTTIVSDEDYEYLTNFLWRSDNRYIVRSKKINNIYITVLIHRVIAKRMNLSLAYEIDHIDRNPRNNDRSNLREATHMQNTRNSSKHKNCTSKYKGVSYDSKREKWRAKINCDELEYYLGRFNSEEDAALAYNKAAIRLHGQFAVLNIIE